MPRFAIGVPSHEITTGFFSKKSAEAGASVMVWMKMPSTSSRIGRSARRVSQLAGTVHGSMLL
jgi:hypothetical protein